MFFFQEIVEGIGKDAATLKISEHFTLVQMAIIWIGSYLVITTQISMIIYFRSAWITGAYANSGSGKKEKDSKLELHEVREVKNDIFQYLDRIVFYAMTFTIPLLDSGKMYPVMVMIMLGTGAFGKTVLNLVEKAKKIASGGRGDVLKIEEESK